MYKGKMIANIRMNMVSKINSARSSWEIDHLSFWGEYKNLIIKYLSLHIIEE